MMLFLYGIVTTNPAVVGFLARVKRSSVLGHSVAWNVHARPRDLEMWLCIFGAMEWVTPTPTRWRVISWVLCAIVGVCC